MGPGLRGGLRPDEVWQHVCSAAVTGQSPLPESSPHPHHVGQPLPGPHDFCRGPTGRGQLEPVNIPEAVTPSWKSLKATPLLGPGPPVGEATVEAAMVTTALEHLGFRTYPMRPQQGQVVG